MLICEVDVSRMLACAAETRDALDRLMRAAAADAAREGAAEAQRVGPYQDRTTNLRRTISARLLGLTRGGSVDWEILAAAHYALFVDQPTKPHVINAKNAPYLHFKGRHGWVKTKSVNHPGTRGYPFAKPGFDKAVSELEKGFAVLQSTLNRIWR